MDVAQPVREGDHVELLPGAPVPRHHALRAGARGRVVVADAATDPDPRAEITVLFGLYGRPVRLHRRWVRVLSRPPRRGRRWSAPGV